MLVIALAVVIGSRQKKIKTERSELGTRIPPTGRKGFRDIIGEEQLPLLSASPTPLISPRPSPTPFSLSKTYQVTISESELNTYLTESLVDPTRSTDNPIVSAKITLHEGMGVLKAHWEKGQTLTAEIHVTADGKGLTVEDLSVTGAGLLTGLFEQVAYDFLNGVVNTFIAESRMLEQIKIKPGELVLDYRLF